MTKKNTTPEYVTREILKEEISASEKRLEAEISGVEVRLDAKIETTAQSLKEYTDSRFTRLEGKMENTAQSLKEHSTTLFRQLDAKMTANQKDIMKVLSNHEERITILEGRGPQPSRI